MHRFFVPALGAPGDLVTLPADEGTHLARVLRLGPGDRVALVDGRGGACVAAIEATQPQVVARIGDAVAPAPEPRVHMTLAPAILKGDGFDQVVRDAVMLGVSAIQPVVSTRTALSRRDVRTHGAAGAGGGAPAPSINDIARSRRMDRWTRIALASMKQCGGAVLPAIAPPADLCALLSADREGARLMLVEPQADAADCVTLTALGKQAVPAAATLIVGPEGGWTAEELTAARAAGWTFLTLGGRTLRAEAAPIVALAALWTIWREF